MEINRKRILEDDDYYKKVCDTNDTTPETLAWDNKYAQSQELQRQISDKRLQEYEIIQHYNGVRHKETTTLHLPEILTTDDVNNILDLFELQNQITSLQEAQNNIWK